LLGIWPSRSKGVEQDLSVMSEQGPHKGIGSSTNDLNAESDSDESTRLQLGHPHDRAKAPIGGKTQAKDAMHTIVRYHLAQCFSRKCHAASIQAPRHHLLHPALVMCKAGFGGEIEYDIEAGHAVRYKPANRIIKPS